MQYLTSLRIGDGVRMKVVSDDHLDKPHRVEVSFNGERGLQSIVLTRLYSPSNTNLADAHSSVLRGVSEMGGDLARAFEKGWLTREGLQLALDA